MSQGKVDVVIVGAGPYGLSLASQLSERGIERRIFGFPMCAWREMPPDMFLKSFGFATSIPTPKRGYTLPEYVAREDWRISSQSNTPRLRSTASGFSSSLCPTWRRYTLPESRASTRASRSVLRRASGS